jgi:hypothetical protein
MIEGLLRPSHLLVALFVFGPKKLPELGKVAIRSDGSSFNLSGGTQSDPTISPVEDRP